MFKLAVLVSIIAVAMALLRVRNWRKQARRRIRYRRIDRHWVGYAKAWDAVFKRKKAPRITHAPPPDSAE